jgi:hypothetical protein
MKLRSPGQEPTEQQVEELHGGDTYPTCTLACQLNTTARCIAPRNNQASLPYDVGPLPRAPAERLALNPNSEPDTADISVLTR